MPDFISLAIPNEQLPDFPVGLTPVRHTINPSQFATYPIIGDTIRICELPEGAEVRGAMFSVSGDIGAASSTLQLQVKQGADAAINITSALAATTAGTAAQNALPPVASAAKKTVVQLVVAGGNLDASGTIDVAFEWMRRL